MILILKCVAVEELVCQVEDIHLAVVAHLTIDILIYAVVEHLK